MKCPNCGVEGSDEALVCRNCGLEFDRRIPGSPQDVTGLVRHGLELIQRGQVQQAVQVFQQAHQTAPADFDAEHYLGAALAQLGHTARALTHLRGAVQKNPNSAPARYNLGYALERAGRTDEAVRQYEQAAAVDPNHQQALAALQRLSGARATAASAVEATPLGGASAGAPPRVPAPGMGAAAATRPSEPSRRAVPQDQGKRDPVLAPAVAALVGLVSSIVLAQLLYLFISPQAVPEVRAEFFRRFFVWTQPFLFLVVGLIAARLDEERSMLSAPVAALVTAVLAVVAALLRKMITMDPVLIVGLPAAGAVLGVGAGVLAKYLPRAVPIGIGVVVGLGLFVAGKRFLRQSCVYGWAEREQISRAAGVTTGWVTVRVPNSIIELWTTDGKKKLYATVTDEKGNYGFRNLPKGKYLMRYRLEGQPQEQLANQEQEVLASESMTRGEGEIVVSLPTEIRDMGSIFDEGPGPARSGPSGGTAPGTPIGGIGVGPITPVTPGDLGGGGGGPASVMLEKARKTRERAQGRPGLGGSR